MQKEEYKLGKKGNLMSVRHDIKVLDATIRDGGLVNDFYFDDEFIRDLYKANVDAGVDYMEFGYKASRTFLTRINSANGSSVTNSP